MTTRQPVSTVLLWLACASIVATQTTAPRPPTPAEPIAAILDAFRTHEIVTLTDPHGNVQVQEFLLSLIRDPRFAEIVDDLVVETASARYQDAIDRFIRGDDVGREVLRKAWEEHTVPNTVTAGGVHTEETIRTVRALNASLDDSRKLRVIAGDPPIDWGNVTIQEDHRRWIELRDSYPADLIRRQVLDRGRRALVMYGQGHLQRRQIVSNYDMSTWQSQTVVSLIERDPAVRVFNIWTVLDRTVSLPDGVASWPVPALAALQGTTLGTRDFGLYSQGLGTGIRFGVRNGQLAPVPRDEWKLMRMEEEFDALLYLGPPSAMTSVTIPAGLCQDTQFVKRHVERLERFAPPVEVSQFKKACSAEQLSNGK